MNPGSSTAFQRRTEPGAGLLLATVLSALLATAAAVLIESGRSVRAAVSEQQRLESARLQAEGLVAAAIVALDAGDKRLSLNGEVSSAPHEAAGVVRLQDANGLVDINKADPSVLAALFRALGIAGEEAAGMADRIADWREADRDKRPQGANEADYAVAGRDPPGHRPFVSETELVQVLGLSPALVECVSPYLTVHSTADQIDPAVSPPRLRDLLGLPHLPGGGIAFGPPLGHVVLITAEAPMSRGAAVRVQQWVRLTGDASSPVLIHRAAFGLVPANAPPAPERCSSAAPVEGA